MNNLAETILLGLIGGGLTALTGAYIATRRLRAEIHKIDAEASVSEQSAKSHEATAAVKLIDAARELIEPYQEQVIILRTELAEARRDVAELARINRETNARVRLLEQHVARLEAELRAVGVTPPAQPERIGDPK